MRSRGDKFLLGFLAFGLLFYLLTMLSDEDSLNNSITDSSAALMDTAIAKPSPGTTQRIDGNVSLVSYDLQAETTTRWKLAVGFGSSLRLTTRLDSSLSR